VPFVPTAPNRNRPRSRPIPRDMLDKLHEKRRAYRYFRKYRTQENYNAYAKIRNQVKKASRNATKFREQKIAKAAKNNPKRFYQYVASKTKPKESVSTLLRDDGSLAQNDEDKAEVLNAFFASVFTNENDDVIPEFTCDKPVDFLSSVVVTVPEMEKALKKLNISKSPGPDRIHPRVLKELHVELALPLTILFNKSMSEGVVRVCVCVHTGYQQISLATNILLMATLLHSLTSVVCKVFEGFVRDALNKHLLVNDLLSSSQFGFTSGRSCITQLLTTVNDWMIDIEDGKPVDAIYLDLRKAFDTVPHKRLINKLKGYGITGSLLNWVKDFLSNRSQFVKINNASSSNTDVSSGVPQGSVVGPTLFIYFINDMPDVVDCMVRVFADDTKAYTSVESDSKRQMLQDSLDKLVEWTDTWLLHFNSTKCKVIHMGKNNPNFEYFMKDDVTVNLLESVKAERDLGVIVDEDLHFEDHINEIVKRANRISGLLIRTITYKDKCIMVPLFKALVRPILEYGNAVWCPKLRKHINEIENVQRRFTKCIIGQKDLTYEERLKWLGLPSLEFRRLRGDMIEVFKILHHIYDPKTTQNLLHKADSSLTVTRGHDLRLTKKSVKSSRFQQFFTNRVINTWNSLPQEAVSVDSVNAFKGRLDKFLASQVFSTNI